jgi:hypothetical protein
MVCVEVLRLTKGSTSFVFVTDELFFWEGRIILLFRSSTFESSEIAGI